MVKQPNKKSVIPVADDLQVTKAGIQEKTYLHKASEELLSSIADKKRRMEEVVASYNKEIEPITAKHNQCMDYLKCAQEEDEKNLLAIMKKNKGVLFDGTDVVNLPHGSLIHTLGDKVSIPKTALAACKENEFLDVIKIVESLDRDAIEKWPDAKLVLIGAERKPKEEFEYSLKK